MDLQTIGKRIELERVRLNLKSSEVCTALDIHANTYRNYETGKRDMPISLLSTLWGVGFDVMYILTGQRLQELAADAIDDDTSIDALPMYHQRLVNLPEVMDINNPSDALLTAMYHAEETLIQAGATANEDYDYKLLATLGLGLLDTVK